MIEQLDAKWPPKAAKEDAKADTERPKVAKARPERPQGAQHRKNHEKSSSKHAPKQRRTMKNVGFPSVFVYFAESPWYMALGPMVYGIWLFALEIWLAA